MHHPTDRIANTTAFVTPVVEYCQEREIAQWVSCGQMQMFWNTYTDYILSHFFLARIGGMEDYGKSVHSWCDGSSDRSFMGWTH